MRHLLITVTLFFLTSSSNSTHEIEKVGTAAYDHKHLVTYHDFNKKTTNESYLRTENDLQTNKEIESINVTRTSKDIGLTTADNPVTFAVWEKREDGHKDNNDVVVDVKVNTSDNNHNKGNLTLEALNAQGKDDVKEAKSGHLEAEQLREVRNAVDYGIRKLEELVKVKEPFLYKLGFFLHSKDPAAKVANFGAPNNQRALLLSRFGFATLEASRRLSESFQKNAGRQPAGIPFDVQPRVDLDECPLRGRPQCPPASLRFRTADGTCNNLHHPWRGSAMLPMQRFLPPLYEDGIQSVRLSVFGTTLPSAREISTNIHKDQNREVSSVTLMFTQWGQFIDHDITSTVKSRAFNGSIPRCCSEGNRGVLPSQFLHPSCLPIDVPPTDRFLNRFGIGCIEFTRSAPSTRIECDLGWREQINQATSYIDASTIYGSDSDISDFIRTFRNGMIFYGKPSPLDGISDDFPSEDFCRSGPLTEECIQPGDLRVSENPGLVAIHTVFVRYHNKVASILSQINSHWSDERVFQEAKRIVYSVIQHITYREYLPVVVGPQVMDLFDLRLTNTGYYKSYDARVNPTVANSFSTAAFRFGHSMVQNSFVRSDSHHRPIPNNVSLHNELFNDENIWSIGSLDRLLLGLINQPSQKRDEFVAEELTNHLFQFGDSSPFGMDLAAINIQRGRDHGIPPYTSWRKPCALSPIKRWEDLEKVISIQAVMRLRTLYAHVDDIDLFTAGLAEKPLKGAVVGPTFACIIAQQFSNLRKGDRFWYENGGFASAFSLEQLAQIRRVSLAQVICQTIDEVQTIQPFVFLSADSFRNIRVSCDSKEIKSLDLAAWREEGFELNNIGSENDDNFESERSQRMTTNSKAKLTRQRRSSKSKKTKTTTSPSLLSEKTKVTNLKPTETAQLKYETFTYKTKPTKLSKPSYYNLQNQTSNDVTYLMGLVPQASTRAPPLQINININYGTHGVTVTVPKGRPTNRPISSTPRPTDVGNDALLVTKRPMTTTTNKGPVSYPTFIYTAPSRRPTILTNNMDYATTHGLKRPNSNKLIVRPTATSHDYYTSQRPTPAYDYLFDHDFDQRPAYLTDGHKKKFSTRPSYIHRPTPAYDYLSDDNFDHEPAYLTATDGHKKKFSTRPSTTQEPTPVNDYLFDDNFDHRPTYLSATDGQKQRYTTRPSTVFEDQPFSISYDRTKKPPYRNFYEYNTNRPLQETYFYHRDEDNSDDISQEFFDRFDEDVGENDKSVADRVYVDGKLDFGSRDFIQMSAVKKVETFGLEPRDNLHHMNSSKTRLKRSEKLNIDPEVKLTRDNSNPSLPGLNMGLPMSLPCSYEVPRPMIEVLSAVEPNEVTVRTL